LDKLNRKNPYVFGPSLLPLYYKAIVNNYLKIKDKLLFLACFIYVFKLYTNSSGDSLRYMDVPQLEPSI
jgi:hypothetical protein